MCVSRGCHRDSARAGLGGNAGSSGVLPARRVQVPILLSLLFYYCINNIDILLYYCISILSTTLINIILLLLYSYYYYTQVLRVRRRLRVPGEAEVVLPSRPGLCTYLSM